MLQLGDKVYIIYGNQVRSEIVNFVATDLVHFVGRPYARKYHECFESVQECHRVLKNAMLQFANEADKKIEAYERLAVSLQEIEGVHINKEEFVPLSKIKELLKVCKEQIKG